MQEHDVTKEHLQGLMDESEHLMADSNHKVSATDHWAPRSGPLRGRPMAPLGPASAAAPAACGAMAPNSMHTARTRKRRITIADGFNPSTRKMINT